MGKRMSRLNICAQFPPLRKWMEVLPVHSQHPSCLHPLSRGEGMGFIWILDNCYCFSEAGRLTFWPVRLWGNQKQTPLLPLTKGQLFDPICFCYFVLGPHSFEYKFFKRYLQWAQLCFRHTGLRELLQFFFVVSDPVCCLTHFSVITRLCLIRPDWHLLNVKLILGGLQLLRGVIVFVSLNETPKPA